ncbi:nucleotidyl cyclase domain-containing protein [Enterovibrio coralii]|uniref:hypothetical protein n=1 Tax=Enterovibrio coralii TaxID=294935 RepID=UPI000AF10F64|nr:hypothetical protein [Enterovibrio coralii]
MISISVGGVTVSNSENVDASKLIAYAEIALSKAIALGRNQANWIYAPEKNQPQERG